MMMIVSCFRKTPVRFYAHMVVYPVSFTGTTTPGTPVHVSEVWNPVRLIVILLHRNAALAWTDVITFLQKCLKYQFAEWVLFKINGFDNFLLGEFVFYK